MTDLAVPDPIARAKALRVALATYESWSPMLSMPCADAKAVLAEYDALVAEAVRLRERDADLCRNLSDAADAHANTHREWEAVHNSAVDRIRALEAELAEWKRGAEAAIRDVSRPVDVERIAALEAENAELRRQRPT